MPTLTQTPITASPLRRALDIGAALAPFRHGRSDPTTWISRHGGVDGSGDFVRASHTPDGPGTIHIAWLPTADDTPTDLVGLAGVRISTFGPGGAWLASRAAAMVGLDDQGAPHLESAAHPRVAAAARAGGRLRLGASGNLYHELLPTIIEQRITGGEAHRQWQRLCRTLGDAAPGPFTGLVLPPEPVVLAGRPSWWFHPLGIEIKRAIPLIGVARHASKLWRWADAGTTETSAKLALIDGVGQWTIGSAVATALGDPDALAVGDFHLKNIVANTLADESRGTDERMLELLQPYIGQRGRVVRLLIANGARAPKFGPKKRVLAMHTW